MLCMWEWRGFKRGMPIQNATLARSKDTHRHTTQVSHTTIILLSFNRPNNTTGFYNSCSRKNFNV